MATCRKCPSPVPVNPRATNGAQRSVCDACQQAAHNARRRARYVRAAARPPEEADMGPPWPLLVPPEVAQREEEAMRRRIREALADGLGREEMLERFGHRALYLASQEGLRRPTCRRMAFGVPA